jgi:hypothetical protein
MIGGIATERRTQLRFNEWASMSVPCPNRAHEDAACFITCSLCEGKNFVLANPQFMRKDAFNRDIGIVIACSRCDGRAQYRHHKIEKDSVTKSWMSCLDCDGSGYHTITHPETFTMRSLRILETEGQRPELTNDSEGHWFLATKDRTKMADHDGCEDFLGTIKRALFILAERKAPQPNCSVCGRFMHRVPGSGEWRCFHGTGSLVGQNG